MLTWWRTGVKSAIAIFAMIAAGAVMPMGAAPSAGAAAAASGKSVINELAFYPEGPLWRDGDLYYAEMPMHRIVRWNGTNMVFWRQPGCGPTSIAAYAGSGFIVLCHYSNKLVHVDAAGRTVRIFEVDQEGIGFANPNDSHADDKGGVYFTASGQFDNTAPHTGSVYYLSAAGHVRRVASGLWYSNGVVLAEGGRKLLVSEHLARRVLEFAIRPDGSLAEGKPYVRLDDVAPAADLRYDHAGPDGLEIDRNGNLYICEYGAGRVLILSPAKKLIGTVRFSQQFLTNIALDDTERWLVLTGASNNYAFPFPGRVERLANPIHGTKRASP